MDISQLKKFPGGTPNSWLVYFMENLIYKWMIWGYPYFRKLPYTLRAISKTVGSSKGNGQIWKGPIACNTSVQ